MSEANEAKAKRRKTIGEAMGRERRLSTFEAGLLHAELVDWLSEDPEHDPATHEGKKSVEELATMSFCRQCEAITHLHKLRDFLRDGP